MPVFGEPKNTHKIVLPNYEEEGGAYVVINLEPYANDILTSIVDKDNKASALNILSKIIVDWDFMMADGQKAPITPENVGRIKMSALNFLLEEAEKQLPDLFEKKAPTGSPVSASNT